MSINFKNIKDILDICNEVLINVRKEKPLIHHITNYVTANDCANITLSIGASPVMADDINEVEEMTALAKALVINIGTLNSQKLEAMILAGKIANKNNIPIILDPVGVGATNYRIESCKRLLKEVHFHVIKGNMAEIKVLAGMKGKIKGVDSIEGLENALEIGKKLCKTFNSTIVITGAIDYIISEEKSVKIKNGHPMLSRVTGTGCMSTSLIASYTAICKNGFIGAVCGILSMGIAGERAYENLKEKQSVGSFKVSLFDSIYNLDKEEILNKSNILLI